MHDSDNISPAVDARLRRAARNKGYQLHRSRKPVGADNLGGYMIVDPARRWTMEGDKFDLAPDYVEAWLKDCEPGQLAR